MKNQTTCINPTRFSWFPRPYLVTRSRTYTLLIDQPIFCNTLFYQRLMKRPITNHTNHPTKSNTRIMLDYARYNDYNDPRVISMEDYRLAYYFLSSKVSEIAEILRKPLEGETREQIRNSAAARTVQAMDLLEDARRRSQEMLHASEPQRD